MSAVLKVLAVSVALASLLGSAAIASTPAAAAPVPPTPNASVSYQLGGDYGPEFASGVVIRDSTSSPIAGHYNICYLNGFQTQADQSKWWKRKHRNLLLRKGGRYVIDGQWNEILLDTSTAKKRRAIARVVGKWTDACAQKGFSAVEFDNLDSYQRSRGRLTKSNSVALAKLLVKRAHLRGLAAGQKNASELGDRGRRIAKFDYAIAEECERYRECDSYRAVYGDNLIEVEYTDYATSVFDRACTARGAQISVILRDRQLSPAGEPGYRYAAC